MGNRIGYPTRYAFFVQPSQSVSKEETITESKEKYDEIQEAHDTEKDKVEDTSAVVEEKQSSTTNETESKIEKTDKKESIDKVIDSLTESMAELHHEEKPIFPGEPLVEEKKEEQVLPPSAQSNSQKKKRHRPHKK